MRKKAVFGLILTNVCKKLKLSLFIKEDSWKQLIFKTPPKTTLYKIFLKCLILTYLVIKGTKMIRILMISSSWEFLRLL